MANLKSSKKDAKRALLKREINRSRKARIKTWMKKVLTAVENGEKEKAIEYFSTTTKYLDKAAKVNLFHKNKVARHKSQLMTQIKGMDA